MNHNPDEYYNRPEVSNSDLTALKNLLHPTMQFGDKEKAFKFGTLEDAILTELDRVNYYRLTVDDDSYTREDFLLAEEMVKALKMEARKDPFVANVLKLAETQRWMANQEQKFNYGSFEFTLPTRCKWDWWIDCCHFGGDLKTTAASTQREFEDAVDHFDWDRSRAWYMDIAGSNKDFIIAISKKNCAVFKKFINRGDAIYNNGREKYEELAFNYWCLNV